MKEQTHIIEYPRGVFDENVYANKSLSFINADGKEIQKAPAPTKASLSCVEEFETETAKEYIQHCLEFQTIRPTGYQILVKIYTNSLEKVITKDDGTQAVLVVGQQKNEWASMVGLVLAKGPSCYLAPKFEECVWCEAGDYVMLPRHEGTLFWHRSPKGERYQMMLLPDDRILATIQCPQDIFSFGS
jgi:hypothetical protein